MQLLNLRGLLTLSWLELKIFVREPLGAIGTVAIPVLAFVLLGRATGSRAPRSAVDSGLFGVGGIAVFVSLLIALSAVLSLVTIISIYREGGILKRLRATPLRPHTILTAHVLVKLALTGITMSLMMLAGRRYFAIGPDVPIVSFALALVLCTWSILSIGFVIASVVPTARFAQPVGALFLYPMLGLSGLFFPVASLPAPWRQIASILPLTWAVSLLEGIWKGDGWFAHAGDVTALVVIFVLCTTTSARVFRWE